MEGSLVGRKWGKWAGTNLNRARPAVSLALARFAREDVVAATRTPSLVG
jgi:hypothetical protein